MVNSCSLYSLLKDYRIKAATEGYDELDEQQNQKDMTLILILFFLVFGLWIWSIVLLVQNWSKLKVWAQILGILGILSMNPLGSLFTILLVCIGKKTEGAVVASDFPWSNQTSELGKPPSFATSSLPNSVSGVNSSPTNLTAYRP
jgi:uncharacterized protein (DUF983 family)